MEKTNKVMRIILSVLTFVAIALFATGISALPIETVTNNGNVVNSYNIFDIIDRFIETIKQLSGTGDAALQYIAPLLMILTMIIFTAVFGIIALIKGIILLVKTIRGMAGKGDFEGLLRTLVGFGSVLVVYIALLLGDIYSREGTQVVSLGIGSVMVLSGGLLALAIAGFYRIAVKDERKLVNKILSLGTSTLAIVGLVLALTASVSVPEDTTTGIIYVITVFVRYVTTATGTNPETMTGLLIAMAGAIVVLVSVGFAKSLIVNGFTLYDEYADEEKDYYKSSIVKSSLWLSFMIIGFVVIAVMLSKDNYSLGIGAIIGMAMGVLALAASIVNKCLSGKPADVPEVEEAAE